MMANKTAVRKKTKPKRKLSLEAAARAVAIWLKSPEGKRKSQKVFNETEAMLQKIREMSRPKLRSY
jgi:hypothetical protein